MKYYTQETIENKLYDVILTCCPKCANITYELKQAPSPYSKPNYAETWNDWPVKKCKFCKSKLVLIPDENEKDLIDKFILNMDSSYRVKDQEEAEQYILEHYAPNADPDLIQQREDATDHLKVTYTEDGRIHLESTKHPSDSQTAVPQPQPRPQIKCPYCGSTSYKKITLTKKVVKTGLFGALGAASDAGKTYQCNNCKAKW